MSLTVRDAATIAAALRFYQDSMAVPERQPPMRFRFMASIGNSIEPLESDEIDKLCQIIGDIRDDQAEAMRLLRRVAKLRNKKGFRFHTLCLPHPLWLEIEAAIKTDDHDNETSSKNHG